MISTKINIHTRFVETLIFIWIIMFVSVPAGSFLLCINNQIDTVSIVVLLIFGIIVSTVLMNVYYTRCPIGLTLQDDVIIIDTFFSKRKTYIKDIIKITEPEKMSIYGGNGLFEGCYMYVIRYERNTIYLNTQRYNGMRRFIEELKKKL